MSILQICDEGWILCHKDYVSQIYKATLHDSEVAEFAIRNELFDIKFPYKTNAVNSPALIDESSASRKKRKRLAKKASIELDTKVKEIKTNFTKIVECARSNNIFQKAPIKLISGNLEAREAAIECLSSTEVMRIDDAFEGGNNSSQPIFQKLKNFDLLIPPNCRFICGDVRKTIHNVNNQFFDLVLMDPPWWNKYIRRLKKAKADLSYDMLYNDDIKNLPIAPILSTEAIVAVWCTNCEDHERSVIDEMFDSWTVRHVATWYWMKVTKSGEPICPFANGNGKQPFERIIIGTNMKDITLLKKTDAKIIVSVPSSLHSHKPPINELLLPFLKDDSRCLEIFARYLLPNTTSLGLEPLRWQHTALYVKK